MFKKLVIVTACSAALSGCLQTTQGGIPVVNTALVDSGGCRNLDGSKSQMESMLATGRYANCLNNHSAALYR